MSVVVDILRLVATVTLAVLAGKLISNPCRKLSGKENKFFNFFL